MPRLIRRSTAYFSTGTDGHIRIVNRSAVELFGYTRAELVGRPVLKFCADTPAGKEKARELFPRFYGGEEIHEEALEMRAADGRSVWVSLTVRPIRDAQGQVVASRSTVIDITGRKRAEAAPRAATLRPCMCR